VNGGVANYHTLSHY